MGIKRYKATKDNTITNAFRENLTIRGTGSNMGQSDTIEVFGIYGQQSSDGVTFDSSEVARALIEFDASEISTDRSNGTIPASGSVDFFLKLYNARHIVALPRNYKISVHGVSGSWEEGHGIDMDEYLDKTHDKIGSNWLMATGKPAGATCTLTATAAGVGDANTRYLLITDAAGNSVNFQILNSTATSTATVIGFNGAANSASTFATRIAQAITAAVTAETLTNLTATASSATVTITSTTGLNEGFTRAGNNIVTPTGTSISDGVISVASSWGGSKGKWETAGGDFYTDTSSSFEQQFDIGNEDLEINVTTLVEQWVNSTGNILGGKPNHGFMIKLSSSFEPYSSTNTDGAVESYYKKIFFARTSEYFFRRPCVEARWDSSKKDDRGNFYFSSSMVPAYENLNTIYLFNYVRGNLRNIPTIDTEHIYVSLYSGSADDDGPDGVALLPTADGTYVNDTSPHVITGGLVSTGIYSASFAITGTYALETIYDVWFTGSHVTSADSGDPNGSIVQFHTGSIKTNVYQASSINPNGKYVVSMPYLKNRYSNDETERFRIYVRNKNWSPSVYSVAESTPQTLTIESASFQVTRTVDQRVVIPYGTASSDNLCTMMSTDVSGNYFDLDLSMLEPGYTYGLQYSFYEDSVGSYRQQPYLFKFRVEKHEY